MLIGSAGSIQLCPNNYYSFVHILQLKGILALINFSFNFNVQYQKALVLSFNVSWDLAPGCFTTQTELHPGF